MTTTFLLNGGAGRIVAAIPALQKYHQKNPDDDFKVIIQGWSQIYHNHPLLHKKTYNYADRGIFELFIKQSTLVYPEPYYNQEYYNQCQHMVEAFDQIINNENSNADSLLHKKDVYLHVSKHEENQIKQIIKSITDQTKKKDVVVFQPYGSGIVSKNGEKPFDPSYRSFDPDDALIIMRILSEKYTVIYFGPDEFRHPFDHYSVDLSSVANRDIRFYMNMIRECHFFIGVDSSGNHIANAFRKKNALVLGSTFYTNVGYPDSIFFSNDIVPVYSPIRICDSTYEDEINSRCMEFSEDVLENIARSPDFI